MVETASIVNMCISGAFALLLPATLLIVWRKKTHAPFVSAIVGALTFVVFVYGLENLMHQFCIYQDNAVSRFINANPWAYYLYASLAAGVFEETGRFIAFSLPLKKRVAKANGVMYGIGHGGIEAILVCTLSMITLLGYAFMLNASGAEALLNSVPEAARESMAAVVTTLTETTPGMFLGSGFERLSAVILHIGLSVFVFAAVREKRKRWLYPVAIGLHALVDGVAVVLFRGGAIESTALLEAIIFVMSIGIAVAAYFIYRATPDPEASIIADEGAGNGDEPAAVAE